MNLTTKFLLIFSVTAFIFIVIFSVSLDILFINQTKDIERVEAEADGVSVYAALESLVQNLRAHTVDYGGWGEMLYFARNRNKEWAVENIDNWVPISFHVDIALVFDANGQPVHEYYGEDQPKILDAVREHNIFEETIEETSVSGFIDAEGEMFYYAASVITWTEVELTEDNYLIIEEDTPIGGIYFTAIRLDGDVEAMAQDITGKEITFAALGDFENSVQYYLDNPTEIDEANNLIRLHQPIRSDEGEVIGCVCLTKEMRILSFAGASVVHMILTQILLILLFIAASAVITIMVWSRPLKKLSETISESKPESLKPLPQAERNDEIGEVASSFNSLTKTLHKYISRLEKSRRELEKERTETEKRMERIDKMNKFMVGRELEMDKIKRRIEEYKKILKENDIKDPFDER